MISRYEVSLNGKALSAISPDILILDIQYPPATIRNESFSLAKRQGAQVTRRYLESNSVSILFEIRSYDVYERQTILNSVVRWARDGGILQTNDRQGQRLRCICEQFPSVTSAKNRAQEMQIVFTAHSLPFWEEDFPARLTLTGSNTSGSLYVPGNVNGAFVEATAIANGRLTTIKFTAGNTELILSGIDVASGGRVVISYDDNMIQSIKAGNTSLLPNRSGDDDLLVNSGEITRFAVVANVSCSVEYRVRGLWL